MELKYNDVFFHINRWYWGESVDIVKDDGAAIVCVKFDEKTFPKTGYICDLSVIAKERKKGLGQKMMKYALFCCEDHGMTFARLHVDAKNIWLREWYERLGFKELSRDENEIELIKKLKDNAKKENANRIKDHNVAFGLYQEVIENQKKSIRNLWLAFAIMSMAWLVLLIAYIMK